MLVKLGLLELKIFSNSISDHHCFRKIAEVQWQHFVSNSEVRKFLFGYIDDNSISIKDFSGLNICYECHPGGFHIVHCLPRSKLVKKFGEVVTLWHDTGIWNKIVQDQLGEFFWVVFFHLKCFSYYLILPFT